MDSETFDNESDYLRRKIKTLEERNKLQDAALHDLWNVVMVMKQKVMKLEERK